MKKRIIKTANRSGFFKKNFFSSLNSFFLFLLILFLPTQLGKHFFLSQSYLFGIRVDYLAPTIYFFDILTIIVFFINFNYLLKSFIQKRFILLLLLLIVNSVFSVFPLISINKIIRIFQWWGIFLIIKNQSRLKIKNLMTNAFLISGLFELILSLGQFIAKKSLGSFFWFFGERSFSLATPEIAKVNFFGIEALRSYGTFSHPNSLAGFYLLIYFYYLTLDNKKMRGVDKRFFIILVSSFLIFLSFSKLALVLWFFGTLFYYWHQKLDCRLCFLSRLITLTTVFFVFISFPTSQFSFQNRVILLKEWLEIFRYRWFLGVGLGAYSKAKEFIKPIVYPYYLTTQPVHNVFLLLLAEMGIVPFFVFLLFLFPWLKKLWIKNKLMVLMFITTALFDHYWWTLPQNFFLLSLITAISLF